MFSATVQLPSSTAPVPPAGWTMSFTVILFAWLPRIAASPVLVKERVGYSLLPAVNW